MNDIDNIPVCELLPQQPPFVMIDRLLHFDEKTVRSGLRVAADNLFVSDGVLTAPGLIENMAQTAAARMGYIGKYLENGTIKLGFIGEIKRLSIERCPAVGEELTTTVEITNEVFSTLVVQARAETASGTAASCEMKIFMTDIDSQA